MSNRVLHEFRYRLDPITTAIAMLLFAGMCGLSSYFVMNPGDKPAVVRPFGLALTMTPGQNQVFMGAIAIGSAICLVLVVRALVLGLYGGRVALTDESLLVPEPDWFRFACGPKELELPLDDIISAEAVTLPGLGAGKQLTIKHVGGRISIHSSMLASDREFDRLVQFLSSVCASAREYRASE